MSLLIKALNKAEEAQSQNAKTDIANNKADVANSVKASDAGLSLSPKDSALNTGHHQAESRADISAAPAPKQTSASAASSFSAGAKSASTSAVYKNVATASATNASAANVFSAKRAETSRETKILALLAGLALIALLAMAWYFSRFIDNTPEIAPLPRPLESVSVAPVQEPASTAAPLESEQPAQLIKSAELIPLEQPIQAVAQPETDVNTAVPDEKLDLNPAQEKNAAKTPNEVTALRDAQDAETEASVGSAQKPKSSKQSTRAKSIQFGEAMVAQSASMRVTKSKTEPSVNPVVMRAFEAYNAGNDSEAQGLYKQVLQRDIRNVDALLGLGAIATRQGRTQDANSWFSKVLALDPRNSVAQAALLDSNLEANGVNGNEQASETHLKNMLAKQPDDANLHTALGHLYAEQNQWPAAQQAYFDAYRYNANADNAYNLAISLDQIGKPKLALPYYQQALAEAPSNSHIDKAALEARIAAIQ